ncbi:hypothetical protein [Streptomyces sp. NPDC001340]
MSEQPKGAATGEDPTAGPTVYRFNSTWEAYNATQCRDDIRDGDVLVVESEGVTGFLDAAWPVAITEAHGQFHGLMILEREVDHFAASIALATWIANQHGFPLAAGPSHSA